MIYRERTRQEAMQLFRSGAFAEALPILADVARRDPTDWNAIYLAGQCSRLTGDLTAAVRYLRTAADVAPNQPEVLLALGIAHQLRGDLGPAAATLERAVRIDPDYVLAYNSLGITYRKAGDVAGALKAYDDGLSALARSIAKTLENRRDSPLLPHRETVGEIWVTVVMRAALWLAATGESVGQVAFPTAEQAVRWERSKEHAGLYWLDMPKSSEDVARLYLPNFFNTLQYHLRADRIYADLIGNTGTVYEQLGRLEDAQRHFDEAEEFVGD